MKKKKRHSITGKIILGTVALIFLLYGCFLTVLWAAGIPIRARVTEFRREMQERGETIRNQYTYAYSYEFSVSGKKYSGHSKKVQGPLFLKNDGTSMIKVKYLRCCPWLNCPEDDFTPWYKIPIFFGVSMVLGYFMMKIK